jgi:ADP-ribose pyrophosphatase
MAKESLWESLELTHLWYEPFPLVRERLRTHSGGEATYVYIPGRHEWVCVLPITAEGKVVLLRRYRHVWGDYFLDFPGGGANPDETPEVTIRRGLLEEAGLGAGELMALPRHRYLESLVASMGNPFLALGVRQIQPATPEDAELIEIVELPLEGVYEMLDAYEGFDAGAVIALFRAQPILTERGFLG